MYKYKSICRFKMLVYTDTDILEIRPQQIIESSVEIKHPHLKLIEPKKKKKKAVKKKQYKVKNKEIDHGESR